VQGTKALGPTVNATTHILLIQRPGVSTAKLADELTAAGYATRSVSKRTEALREFAGASRPDLVILVGVHADREDLALLAALKERATPRFLPVIMLCAGDDAVAWALALHAGADDVLPRGVGGAELAARAASLLRIQAAQDALQREKAELERLSTTDPLTGLMNRRYFQRRLDQEVERASRHGGAVSVVLMDLDHFKAVNDRYGHPVGDAALREVAECVRGSLRRVDEVTRWGGEELAIILPGTDRAGAQIVADRLLRALRSRPALLAPPLRGARPRPEAVQLTASLGVAAYPCPEARRADDLFKLADAALYRAKDTGRNRVCVAWDGPRAHRMPAPTPTLLTARPALA
jgi:two-component system, cell cycle response regulator